MRFERVFMAILGSAFLFVCPQDLGASTLDFNLFTPNPPHAIFIDPDGLYAIIEEDPGDGGMNPVTLEYETLAIPPTAVSLDFDYDLYVARHGNDYFDFYIGGVSEPAFEAGGIGEFTAGGHFSYDLSDMAGSTVPVVFHLMSGWGDGDFTSQVTISNVKVSVIPLPGTIWLLGGALIGIMGYRKRRRATHVQPR